MCAKPTEGWGNLQEGGQSYHPLRRSLGSSLHLPMMQKWVEYVRRASGDSCIWNTGHQYGDWLALDAGDGSYTGASRKNFIATAFYAHSAQLLAQAMDADRMRTGAALWSCGEPRPRCRAACGTGSVQWKPPDDRLCRNAVFVTRAE